MKRPLTPWQKGIVVYAVFALMLVGALVMIARRASAEIVVNVPSAERTYTAQELARAIDGALAIQQRLHDREVASVVAGAQDYVRIQLATGCPDRV